ncbi:hypothetical protein MNB_SV-5-1494 [hydrothermal vent metagenome]|uniref:DUF3995 domain-containing protein n=1 Tax=hydrothermal vent metagenome TaxID=652676 RepID=A0A1W1EDV5_9ZZZZ
MILTYILLLLAGIHFYWASDGKFGLDKALPTDKKGNKLLNPSKFMTCLVGFILLGFSYVAYKLYTGDKSPIIVYAGYGLSILFFLRSIGDFNLVGMFKKVKNTEFSKYDTWVYIPLCLFISINFLFLVSYKC